MTEEMSPAIVEVRVPGSAATWEQFGFRIDAGLIRLDRCSIRPEAEQVALAVSTLGTERDFLGIPLIEAPAESSGAPWADGHTHPNQIIGTDHIVIMAPSASATVAAIESLGWDFRRRRPTTMMGTDAVQLFAWAGAALLEIVCPVDEWGDTSSDGSASGTASVWGISLTSADLDTTVAGLGERIGTARDAVQTGRRIATLRRRGTDLGVEVAVMSPHRQDS